MKPVTVGRYHPKQWVPFTDGPAPGEGEITGPPDYQNPWLGWVETEDWVVYQHRDGSLFCYHGRGESGAVLPEAAAAILMPDGTVYANPSEVEVADAIGKVAYFDEAD